VIAETGRRRALVSVEVGDPAHDQAARNLVGLGLGGERDEVDLGDLGPRGPLPGGFVEDRIGVLDRRSRIPRDAGDRGFDSLVHPGRHRRRRATGSRGAHRVATVERGVHPHQHCRAGIENPAGGGNRVGDQTLPATG